MTNPPGSVTRPLRLCHRRRPNTWSVSLGNRGTPWEHMTPPVTGGFPDRGDLRDRSPRGSGGQRTSQIAMIVTQTPKQPSRETRFARAGRRVTRSAP